MPKPPSFHRLLWKAADRIHGSLCRLHPAPTDLSVPDASWRLWQRCLRRLHQAERRNWHVALELVRRESLTALVELTDRLQATRNGLTAPAGRTTLATAGDIYLDLVSLQDEFVSVTAEFACGSISATTEPIVLEGTDLGPFEIQLNWTRSGDPLVYQVLASEPRPAMSSPDVTHPHVECEQLCEGDGRPLIRQALQQGRLADFFLIVRQILKTYNSGSAYVQLDQWSGRNCPDCGYAYDDDQGVCCPECETDICDRCGRSCESCASVLCGECQSVCTQCSDSTCNGCLHTCCGCDEAVCENCRDVCTDCNTTQCKGCLNDGICSDCQSQDEEAESLETPHAGITTGTDAAVHPVCLGEAVVSP